MDFEGFFAEAFFDGDWFFDYWLEAVIIFVDHAGDEVGGGDCVDSGVLAEDF